MTIMTRMVMMIMMIVILIENDNTLATVTVEDREMSNTVSNSENGRTTSKKKTNIQVTYCSGHMGENKYAL